jgi:hypothetical protein
VLALLPVEFTDLVRFKVPKELSEQSLFGQSQVIPDITFLEPRIVMYGTYVIRTNITHIFYSNVLITVSSTCFEHPSVILRPRDRAAS